jgi:hypothetical protein
MLQKSKAKSKPVRGALRMKISGMLDERHGSVDVGKNKTQTTA